MNLPTEITFTAEDIERWNAMPSDEEMLLARLRRDLGFAQGLVVGVSIMKQAVVEYNALIVTSFGRA